MSEASVLWLPSHEDAQPRTAPVRPLALAPAPAAPAADSADWCCENCDTANTRRKRCRDCGTSRW